MQNHRATGTRCFNCFDVNSGVELCTKCGHPREEASRDRRSLPVGTLLGNKYVIGRILGSGGFGITYRGLDVSLNRRVAVKEYIPNELASRARDGLSIICNSPNDQEPFNYGLRQFFKEGQMIAKFDHPNIVRAYEVFESNGTAYLVMEFLEGRTLRSFLDSEACFPEDKAIEILTFVFDALRVLHDRQVVHRDIKPDNVYLTTEGRTLLLDFGGAKEIVGEHSKSMTAIFSHGYAAPEQYLGDEAKAGPWTDVYGAAALLYRVITGNKPPSALERYGDSQPLNWQGKTVSTSTRNAVEHAMKLKPEDRTRTVRAFQKELEGQIENSPDVTVTHNQKTTSSLPKLAASFVGVVSMGVLVYLYFSNQTGSEHGEPLKLVPPAINLQLAVPNPASSRPAALDAKTVIAPKPQNRKEILNQLISLSQNNRWTEVNPILIVIKSFAERGSGDRTDTTIALNKAEQLLKESQFEAAISEFERIINADPFLADPRFKISIAQLRVGKYDNAINSLIEALLIDPESGAGWLTAAEVFSELQKNDASEASLKLAVYLAKDREKALNYLRGANVNVKSEKFKKIIKKSINELSRVPPR